MLNCGIIDLKPYMLDVETLSAMLAESKNLDKKKQYLGMCRQVKDPETNKIGGVPLFIWGIGELPVLFLSSPENPIIIQNLQTVALNISGNVNTLSYMYMDDVCLCSFRDQVAAKELNVFLDVPFAAV